MHPRTHPSSLTAPADFALQSPLKIPNHVAIIMDGNRRWAKDRNLPAREGHLRGVERAVETLRHLQPMQVQHLTLFAFASANWKRSPQEVAHLFELARDALRRFTPDCKSNDIQLRVIGRRDRLPKVLRRAIAGAEHRTRNGHRTLYLAIDYDARAAIASAAENLNQRCDVEHLDNALRRSHGTPPVDLLIRTGGEHRLSNFLLWESAFAELYFTDVHWPDFSNQHLQQALDAYSARERRYGA